MIIYINTKAICSILLSYIVLICISCKKKEPSPTPITPVTVTVQIPQHLAIYYGYPSLVNGATTTAQAVAEFRSFDIIVLGDSLWVATHPDHAKTTTIIAGLKAAKPAIQVFGYIDVGVSGGPSIHNLSNAQLAQAIDGWKGMGATGIFGDDFGSDFGVNRTRQNYFIDYAKRKSLDLFVNSWFVKDALGGTDCLLTGSDYYLMESLLVGNNTYSSLDAFKKKADSVSVYQKQGKIKAAVVGSTAPGAATMASGTTDKFTIGWFATAMYNFDAYQFTDYWHSASNNKLFFYADPISNYGMQWQDAVPVQSGAGEFLRRSEKYTFYVEGNGSSSGRGYAVSR